MTLPTSNLASMLVHAAQHFGDRPGLIQGDRVWTWTEINDRVTRAASALARRGVKQGDRVLVHSRNCNAMFETQWACWRLGGADELPPNAAGGRLSGLLFARHDPHLRHRLS
jgi:fatty-acyl-CoA synthase